MCLELFLVILSVIQEFVLLPTMSNPPPQQNKACECVSTQCPGSLLFHSVYSTDVSLRSRVTCLLCIAGLKYLLFSINSTQTHTYCTASTSTIHQQYMSHSKNRARSDEGIPFCKFTFQCFVHSHLLTIKVMYLHSNLD